MLNQTEKEANSARIWLHRLEAVAVMAKELNCEEHHACILLEGARFINHETRGKWINQDDLTVLINTILKIVQINQRLNNKADDKPPAQGQDLVPELKPITKVKNSEDEDKKEQKEDLNPDSKNSGFLAGRSTRPDGFLTGKEVGLILNLSPDAVKLLVSQKALSGVIHGRGCYVEPESVENFKRNHSSQDTGTVALLEDWKKPKNISSNIQGVPDGYLRGAPARKILGLKNLDEVKNLIIKGKLKGVLYKSSCYVQPESLEEYKANKGQELNRREDEKASDQSPDSDTPPISELKNSDPVLPKNGDNCIQETQFAVPFPFDFQAAKSQTAQEDTKLSSKGESKLKPEQQTASFDNLSKKSKQTSRDSELMSGFGTTFNIFVRKTIKLGNGNGDSQPEEVCDIKDITNSAPYLGSKIKIHIEQGRIRAVKQLKQPLDSHSEMVTYVVVSDFIKFLRQHLPGAKLVIERKLNSH